MVFGPWSEASFVCVCVLHTKGMLRSDFSVWPLYTLVKRCCFLNFTSFSGPSIKCRQWGLWALCFRGQDQGVHGTKHMCPFRVHSPNPKPCSRYLGPETSSPKTWNIFQDLHSLLQGRILRADSAAHMHNPGLSSDQGLVVCGRRSGQTEGAWTWRYRCVSALNRRWEEKKK